MDHETTVLLALLRSQDQEGIKREVLPWLVFILKTEGEFEIRYLFDLTPAVESKELAKDLDGLCSAEYVAWVVDHDTGDNLLVITEGGKNHLEEQATYPEALVRECSRILADYIGMELRELCAAYPFKEKMAGR